MVAYPAPDAAASTACVGVDLCERARILVVHPSDEMYGADRMLLQVVAGMTMIDNVDLEVWLPSDVPHGDHTLCSELTRRGVAWRHADLPVLRRAYLNPSGILAMVRSARSLRRELRHHPPDLLYCGTSASLLAAPIARSAGIRRCMVHVQERWSGPERRVLRQLARFTTSRIAISASVATQAALRAATVVVENCVDDPVSTFQTTDRPERSDLNLVVASRWNPWKGHETLLRAWNLAGCPGKLTVLGGPPPTGDAVDVPALVDRLVQNPQSVDIVGEVADINAHIAASDALVLPSDQPEPFGLVLVEAFALSRPVIASRAGGPLDIVDESETGWLYDIEDWRSLADVLSKLDRETTVRAGRRARTVYEERYTPTRYRERIRDLVEIELHAARRQPETVGLRSKLRRTVGTRRPAPASGDRPARPTHPN